MNKPAPSIKTDIIDWDYKYYVVDTHNKKFIYGFSARKEADAYKALCKRKGIQADVLPVTDIKDTDFGVPSDLSNWSTFWPKQKGLTDEE